MNGTKKLTAGPIKKCFYAALVLMVLFLSFPFVSAEEDYIINSYDSTIYPLSDGYAEEVIISKVNVFASGDISFSFAYHLSDVVVTVDDVLISHDYEEIGKVSRLSFVIEEEGDHVVMLKLTAPVLTRVDGEKYVFSPTFNFASEVEKFGIRVIVPEDMCIVAPMVPTPTNLYSSGDSFIVEWERLFVERGFYIILGIKECGDEGAPAYYLIAFASLLPIGLYIGYSRRPKEGSISFTTDEAKIWKLIKNGPITQKEIVDSTEFSKAKISRMLQEMEERGAIVREKYKNKNIIKKLK